MLSLFRRWVLAPGKWYAQRDSSQLKWHDNPGCCFKGNRSRLCILDLWYITMTWLNVNEKHTHTSYILTMWQCLRKRPNKYYKGTTKVLEVTLYNASRCLNSFSASSAFGWSWALDFSRGRRERLRFSACKDHGLILVGYAPQHQLGSKHLLNPQSYICMLDCAAYPLLYPFTFSPNVCATRIRKSCKASFACSQALAELCHSNLYMVNTNNFRYMFVYIVLKNHQPIRNISIVVPFPKQWMQFARGTPRKQRGRETRVWQPIQDTQDYEILYWN